VAASRDLAYTVGTWQVSKKENPEEVLATGKYVTVWRKQKDGSWKAVADIGNDDPPKDATKH
jgi:ketosteroid isomerase-like protein